jgi:hypothetical protein
LRRYSAILLTLCALFCAALEIGQRYALPRYKAMDARLNREHARADELRPLPGRPAPVLIVGNSLLKKGINISQLNEKLGPEYAVTRFVVEDTNYLDWYYGLHRLFREGARPRAVVLVLNARQLIAPEVHGDAFATLLMDPHDLLAVKRSVAIDNTTASNLLFANLSRYYGLRSELHKWFLVHLLPDFPDLAAKLRPVTPPLASDDEIDLLAANRLREISSLCAQYGSQFVFVVPPSTAVRDGSGAIQAAGNRVGVQAFVPFQPQQLPADLYSDGFHLNYRGAGVFTDALSTGLRQLLRNDSSTQSAASERHSLIPDDPSSQSKAPNINDSRPVTTGWQGAQ